MQPEGLRDSSRWSKRRSVARTKGSLTGMIPHLNLCERSMRHTRKALYDIAVAIASTLIFQLLYMRPHGLAQRLQIVTAFHARHDAPGAAFGRPLLHDARHLHKVRVA